MGSTLGGPSIYLTEGELAKQPNFLLHLTQLLHFSPYECPRFRSVDVSATDPIVRIRGRCGGDNREEYEDEIAEFSSNPGFLEEDDVASDNTYAEFDFQVKRKRWLFLLASYPDLILEDSDDPEPIVEIPPEIKLLVKVGNQDSDELDAQIKQAMCDSSSQTLAAALVLNFLTSNSFSGWETVSDPEPDPEPDLVHIIAKHSAANIFVTFLKRKTELDLSLNGLTIGRAKFYHAQENLILDTLSTWLKSDIMTPSLQT